MRDRRGFDEWAAEYDADTEGCQGYPFEGYGDVLATIAARVWSGEPQRILDVGVGTGKLSAPLYERGCRIVGLDFSAEMLGRARARMPDAVLIEHDLRQGLPSGLEAMGIDHAISSYALHHFDLQQKVDLLAALVGAIRVGGRVVVGDVGFRTRAELDACRRVTGESWDDSEIYLVVAELQPRLADAGLTGTYTQVSSCAGVLVVERTGQA